MTAGMLLANNGWARDLPALAAREGLSLDGDWRIIVDPYENGYYDYRWQPRDAAIVATGPLG